MTPRSKMVLLKANLDIASGYVCSDPIQREAINEAKRLCAELLVNYDEHGSEVSYRREGYVVGSYRREGYVADPDKREGYVVGSLPFHGIK